MKLKDYLYSNLVFVICNVCLVFITLILLWVFGVNIELIILITVILVIFCVIPIVFDFIRRKNYYDSALNLLDSLEEKYLLVEMIKNGSFIDADILNNILYDTDKSMHEQVKKHREVMSNFEDYIELWCHEIKTPLSTGKMIIENNKSKVTDSIKEELDKMDYYIEQVLYYAKSENANEDYIIKSVDLSDVVNSVIVKNKKDLIKKNIKINIEELDMVKSDSKWLEFIINQIIINSIKYSSKNPTITISSEKSKNNIKLNIQDNGIGIDKTDIDYVFDKGFTGKNGRSKYNSTGIGLYLVKKLIEKLGYSVSIESEINIYTKVTIIFPNSSMISEIK